MQNPTDTSGLGGTTPHQADQAKRGGIHDAVRNAADKAHPAVDQVAAKAHQAADALVDKATQAADSLEARQEQFNDAQERLLESVREYVHEKPIAALGIAVGAGFVLSWLMRD
jgi:ElaB/YqjD/DUF883 family membrane-anchored ribosome-binding protein